MKKKETPMLKQYREIKARSKDAILLFRLGDFYEMFNDDAVKASKILNITLTSRGKTDDGKIPMCGMPYHAASGYIAKLIQAGEKVAICDQVEDAKDAVGIVKRDITRIITPGTVVDDILLHDKNNNFLAAVNIFESKWGLSFLDISTGEFRVSEFSEKADLINELIIVSPAECVLPEKLSVHQDFAEELKFNDIMLSEMPDYEFDFEDNYALLTEHFKTQSLDGFGIEKLESAITCAGAILKFLKENMHKSLQHINKIGYYSTHKHMVLDAQTQNNLEIIDALNKGSQEVSLLNVLDYTVTSMGGRMLRQVLKQPLYDVKAIKYRQGGIKTFLDDYSVLMFLREQLRDVRDIERILSRINCGYANAKDVVALKDSLRTIPSVKDKLAVFKEDIVVDILADLPTMQEQVDFIENALVEDPPVSLRDGGLIKEGYNSELDELKFIAKEGRNWLADFQQKEIERTGIKTLKVKYNQVFGYYIEVTKANVSMIPDNYIRKQTLTNAERFITAELKEYETKIIHAKDKAVELEYELFIGIRNSLAKQTSQFQLLAQAIGLLDVILCFAFVASRNNYICPDINDSDTIEIVDGRHPTVEKIMGEGEFVPNDIKLDCGENQLMLLTGPNMAGKSTYIRQAAILVLMAQTGCFIPAKSAVIGIVDRIFTRVGASDNLARGQSTFMVEMNETANILNNATEKSLIILDEIGRGTSTFDGISIAWAVVEYLSENKSIKAKTLFATHYHELTVLAQKLEGIKNYNVAVKEWNDEIVFLRKIIPGEADKSYGIHVARLAGIPRAVIERSKDILLSLEQGELAGLSNLDNKNDSIKETKTGQLSLFDDNVHPVVESVKKFDLNSCTPLEALNYLSELKKQV